MEGGEGRRGRCRGEGGRREGGRWRWKEGGGGREGGRGREV